MPLYKTGKTKDGKQQYRVVVNYTDRNGEYKTKSKLVYGLNEAKLTEKQLHADVSNAIYPEHGMTIQHLFDEYLTAKQYDVRQTTLEKSKQVLTNHVLPHLSKHKLNKLTLPVLQQWKLDIQAKNLSVTMKKNIYKEFHTMLNYAVKMEYIQKNPLNAVGTFKEVYFEKPQDKLHYYTADEFKQFIAVALEYCESLHDYGFYVFFNIAFYTGMRKGEINALKWSDIEGNIIHVKRSLSQKVKGVGFVETPPKTKSSYRDLQIPVPLMEILQQHKERQAKIPKFTTDFRVCGGVSPLADTSIDMFNRRCASGADLPHIRVHDFRHTHVSLLANESINIQEIARRLGHSDVTVTWNTYAHLYPREEERAIRILNKIT